MKVWLYRTVYIQQLSRYEMALSALCIVYVSYNILIGTRIYFTVGLGDSPDNSFSSALPHSAPVAELRNSQDMAQNKYCTSDSIFSWSIKNSQVY